MGEIVRRGLLLPFSVLLGCCSGPEARSDAESRPAVSAAVEDEPASVLPAAGADGEGEQTAVVFRCEEGRLGAYLIVGTPAELESGQIDEDAVAVRLDSAPSC